MKNSTKIALGVFTAAAATVATIIMAVAGKKDDCIETTCEELDASDESTDEVED